MKYVAVTLIVGALASLGFAWAATGFWSALILRLLSPGTPKPRILDIGSGTGDLAFDLLDSFPDAEVVGLELSEAGVELARASLAGLSDASWQRLGAGLIDCLGEVMT